MLSLLLSFLSYTPEPPALECTETTAAIRKMQPDSQILSDEDLIYFAQYIDGASREHGISMETMVVMAYGESKFDPSVVNLMQISRPWSEDPDGPVYCRKARKNTAASIRCGAFVLAKCQNRFDGKNLYLCWSGFHIEDKVAFLERIKNRWMKLLG